MAATQLATLRAIALACAEWSVRSSWLRYGTILSITLDLAWWASLGLPRLLVRHFPALGSQACSVGNDQQKLERWADITNPVSVRLVFVLRKLYRAN